MKKSTVFIKEQDLNIKLLEKKEKFIILVHYFH